MSLWTRLKGLFSGDGGTPAQPSAGLLGALGAGQTATGMRVSSGTAMQVTAVWACVQAISQDVAKVTPHLKRRLPDGGAVEVTNHPLARILTRPNKWQTWLEFCQFMVVNKLLRGNAYAVILRTGGQLSGLVPVRADEVTIYETADGEIFYDVSPSNEFIRAMIGGSRRLHSEDVHHVRGMSMDGIYGLSPISYARECVGLALATERHGARLFGNGARPSGVLTVPGTLSAEAAERLKDSWNRAQSGVENAHKTAVLEEGTEFKPLSMTSEDAQFLETRKFQVVEICRIFRVPPHKIAHLEDATFSNIEHQNLDYYNDCLMHHFEAIEAAMARDLLRDPSLFVEFDVMRLLRGDAAARFEAYATGRNWGIFSVDEIRAREGLNPLPDGRGREYLRPLNMAVVGSGDTSGEGGDGV